jgi:hypothetical protein
MINVFQSTHNAAGMHTENNHPCCRSTDCCTTSHLALIGRRDTASARRPPALPTVASSAPGILHTPTPQMPRPSRTTQHSKHCSLLWQRTVQWGTNSSAGNVEATQTGSRLQTPQVGPCSNIAAKLPSATLWQCISLRHQSYHPCPAVLETNNCPPCRLHSLPP